jgi:MYXO-CTERM domain-containing protein
LKIRRLHLRASVVLSLLAASAVGASSLAWTGCSAGEGSASLGAALGAADGVGQLVISQVYGAGGNKGATLANDYVEIFNRGTADVSISGWSLQYATASSGKVTTPSPLKNATIKAGEYYLVQMGAAPGANGTALPTADDIGSLALSSTDGTVFLVDNTTQLTCTSAAACAGNADIVDVVGFGSAVTFDGTAAAGVLSTTTSASRDGAGCTDTKDNGADFTVATVSATSPRNSSVALHGCGGTTPPAGGTGMVISQVFGGGASDGTFGSDFIELFNPTSEALSLVGLSLQYGSAAGAFAVAYDGGDPNLIVLPNVTVPAGGYYLVAMNTGSDAGAALPLAADFVGGANLSATSGKVALVNGTTPLTCGATAGSCDSTTYLDLVGYGTANQFEGTAAVGALTYTKSATRNGGGCSVTGDNVADFSVVTPVPHASTSAKNLCVSVGDAGTDGGDAGTSDAGSSDAGTKDAGGGGGSDAGTKDAGTGSTKDAGPGVGSSGGSGSSGVVISQVYGRGSNSGATFDSDYVELFNRGTDAVSLSGLSLQYGSGEGDFASAVDGGDPNLVLLPDMMIQPGQYLLVAMGTPGTTGAALPPVDIQGTASLGGTSGKIALVNRTESLGCGGSGDPCPAGSFVDLIGYGIVSQFEGMAAAPALSSVLAGFRANGGCTDTDENQSDISAELPAPRNSSTALNVCAGGGSSSADGGRSSADGGSGDDTGGDDSSGDDDDDDSTGGSKNTVTTVPNSGGCSVASAGNGSTGNDVSSFGAFAFVALAFAGRRSKKRS